jgi:hypothetical protein
MLRQKGAVHTPVLEEVSFAKDRRHVMELPNPRHRSGLSSRAFLTGTLWQGPSLGQNSDSVPIPYKARFERRRSEAVA